jgi:hypothetical protein
MSHLKTYLPLPPPPPPPPFTKINSRWPPSAGARGPEQQRVPGDAKQRAGRGQRHPAPPQPLRYTVKKEWDGNFPGLWRGDGKNDRGT